MKVRVQYLGYIKNMLNKREEHLEIEDKSSLYDLLNKLAGIHGAAFKKEVYEPGVKDIKTGFSVTINGVFIGQLGGLNAKLNEGDNVMLMSLMSGG
ncbi:MAG: MoaD/ThiS family protein [Candidatus Bathyarchaeota archaeon]|nr:MoaD/ThiS family protein [Candidatus Bathyarchaeum sp.]